MIAGIYYNASGSIFQDTKVSPAQRETMQMGISSSRERNSSNKSRREKSFLGFGLHPIASLVIVAIASVASFYFRSWWIAAVIATIAAAGIALRAGAERLWAIFCKMSLFFGTIIVVNAIIGARNESLLPGLSAGLVQSVRVSALVMAADLFVLCVDPLDLSDAIALALAPFARIGIRAGYFALSSMLVASFVSLFAEEARRLEMARAARCGFPSRGIGGARSLVPLLAPLFVGVLRRAVEVDMALQARGFRIDGQRSTLKDLGPKALDFIVVGAISIAFAAACYAKL